MGQKAKDLTGQRYGQLVITSRAPNREYPRKDGTFSAAVLWNALCDCGNTTVVYAANLKSGQTSTCGCLKQYHGMSHTQEYNSFAAMKQRCRDKNHPLYYRYGGRGITICERWNTFANFHADMGDRPLNKTLDRINNDGNYEPSNCRWADKYTQANNRQP